jgi:hypothetical protein
MAHSYTMGQVAGILRNTLQRMEDCGTFQNDDPALIHLKRRLVLAIAELEVKKLLGPKIPFETPVTLLRIRRPSPPDREPDLEFSSQER